VPGAAAAGRLVSRVMTTTYDVESPLDSLLAAAGDGWITYDARCWSLNERLHPLRLHALRSEWRADFGTLGLAALREGRARRLERAVVLAWPRYASRPLDPGNEASAVKAALDGLVDAGLLPGDTPAFVAALVHVSPERGPDRLRMALVRA